MPTVLQFRRGTTTQNNNFTGTAGELSIDTTIDTIRVHDGSTAGGFEITQNTATQTLTNKTADALTLTGTLTANAGVGSSGQYLESTGTGVRWSTVDATTIENGTSNVVVATDSDVTVSRAGALLATFGTAGLTMASGGFVGDLTGNADTATALSSAVTVELTGDVTGSATFTSAGDTASIATTIAANSVALGTDTTGNYVATGAVSGVGLSGSSSSEGGTFTVTSNATSANTASTIVARDGSGDFSAGVITATATAARYADLAEKYTSDVQYPPGTVVVLGGEAEVTRSDGPTSRAIAGIVSTDPAYLMNNDLEGDTVVDVALIGRVPCMVTGIINKGDLLVSSSRPGHSCAWTNATNPPAGSIVGKAIENKTDEDPGVIEVLVGRL
jgi:hypothetical protein